MESVLLKYPYFGPRILCSVEYKSAFEILL